MLELCLVVEELAAGDMGIAVVFDQTWKVSHQIAALATPAQKEWFFPRFVADDRNLASAWPRSSTRPTSTSPARCTSSMD